MADNMIELVASLNVDDSAKQINTVDIPKLQKKIEGIKIKCELDTEGIASVQAQLSSISKNLKIDVPKINIGLAENNKDVINNVEKRISELKQSLAKEFGIDINKIITNTIKNAQDQITSFSFDLTKLSGEVEKFNYKVNRKKDGNNVVTTIKQTSSRDSDRGAIELLRRQSAEVDKLTQKLEKLQAGFSDKNAPRPILAESSIEQLNGEFDKTDGIIKKIKESTSETFSKMVSDANKAISEYEELGKALRNAENTATDFSSKDIASAKSRLGGQISSFITRVSKSNIDDTQSIIKQAETIKKSFDAIGDSQGLKTARDNFNKLRGDFESLDAVAKKSTFDKNLSNKVRKLTDDINSYANANQRAIKSNKEMSNGKSFASEWSRIIAEMAKGANLSDQEIKQLNADLQSFKKNAKSAGVEGASAFEKFANSFKVVSTYISANQIINSVIGQIREAVAELQTVNDRLTEISKTSDRTTENLRRLGETSFDAASKYGRKASDYLLGVQEMSRAGFGEKASEGMAELSVLAQSAGNMTADLANKYLIATNAAYQYDGSIDKLNDSLDRQNYVTNRYALNMSDLAEGTKIAASQAAQSGIGIDEMTAALATMISTTQQGGEIAARSLRGILMNIQQVKGAVGDGEEDITSESLSKYEKAADELGVSLKEVRNGVESLRNPMVVLDELATAFNKEADDSIKKANLISAIGGKYRGNQLSALLSNWGTYKDILNTFNSEQAVGSALSEAEKSANNWAGSINKVKNSWNELVNQFIDSDDAVSIIQSINTMIQKLTESATMGGLKTVANVLTDLIKLISTLTDKFGTIPVLFAGIAGVGSFKGRGIFGTIDDELDKSVKHLTIFKKNWSDIKADISNPNTKGLAKVGVAFEGMKVKAIATEVAVSALNAALTLGLSLAIEAAIRGVSSLVDKLVVTKEELGEIRDEAVSSAEELKANVEAFTEESDAIDELVQKYKEISLSATDANESKEQLFQIQADLIDKFGGEASGIDLVNGKYEEQIDVINRLSQAKYDEWKRENSAAISRAQKVSEYNVRWYNPDVSYLGHEQQLFKADEIDRNDELAASLYKIKDVSEDIQGIYQKVSGTKFVDGLFSNDLLLSGTLENAKEQLGQIIDEYSKLDTQSSETLKALEEHYKALNKEIENTDFFMSKTREYKAAPVEVIGDIDTQNLDKLNALITATGDVRAEWFKTFDEIESGFGKTIDSMTSALQNLAEGKNLSSSEFWKLMELDADKIITDIKMVGDEFVIDQQQLIQLKDQQIQKQIDSLRLENSTLETKKETLATTIDQAKAELSVIGARGMSNAAYRKEYQDASDKIKQGEKNLQDYGEQIKRNNILISQWSSKLGDTVDQTELLAKRQKEINDELTSLNKELDNYVKAHEKAVDNIVGGLESEQDVLEAQKQTLQDELDILNEQKDTLEDTIKNYESVNKLVQDTVKKEIDALEEQKKSIEDTYNKRIEALKTENEEREDALEYAQKLANLENARNNKRRVLDSTRGWRYETVKEDVVKAENDLATFENEQAIKQLEKERDKEAAVIDDIIKEKEAYSKEWGDILDLIQTEEDELLAAEILGADWREKIASGDIATMRKFRSEYLSHNNSLKNLTNTEIKLKQAAIDAKDAEIKSKKEQIDSWKKYKTEIQNAVTEIKNANEEYMRQIGTIELDENTSLEKREEVFRNFKDKVTGYVTEISNAQSQLDAIQEAQSNLGGDFDYNLNFNGMDELGKAMSGTAAIAASAAMMAGGYNIPKVADDIVNAVSGIWDRLPGFSQGGIIDYTGLAMVHGTPNRKETTFNADDSSKLFKYVHETPNLIADMLNKVSSMTPIKGDTTNSQSVSIGSVNVYANNPAEFSQGLDKELDRYFKSKLVKSYTQR